MSRHDLEDLKELCFELKKDKQIRGKHQALDRVLDAIDDILFPYSKKKHKKTNKQTKKSKEIDWGKTWRKQMGLPSIDTL